MSQTPDSPQSALPEAMVSQLPAAALGVIQNWWAGLPEQSREELSVLWDARAASCEYALVQGSGSGPQWEAMPIQVGVEFMPADDVVDEEAWPVDFYEYLINNPELAIHFNGCFFHICTAHPQARAAVRAGVIEAGFRCPPKDEACRMETLLRHQPGCKAVLRGSRVGGRLQHIAPPSR